jgi:hypothetical protein
MNEAQIKAMTEAIVAGVVAAISQVLAPVVDVENEKAKAWLDDLEKAPVAEQKTMMTQKANYLAAKSAITEDSFDQRAFSKGSFNLRRGSRRAGGTILDY